jgi:Plant protein of unknown function
MMHVLICFPQNLLLMFLHIIEPLQKLMQQRLAVLPGQAREYEHLKIFRIPACYRGSDSAMYEPLAVSIGPYYHGRENLRTMEEYKWKVRFRSCVFIDYIL